jgi:hypothetical protein
MSNDQITIGLDFGTHQTKICIKRTPDEGHGEPSYEFFDFKSPDGKVSYTLPSIVYLNSDRTLSYGVSKSGATKPPQLKEVDETPYTIHVKGQTEALFRKYSTPSNEDNDKEYLKSMLCIYQSKLLKKLELAKAEAKIEYEAEYRQYMKTMNTFRYFKQATFAERNWDGSYDCKTLSIWYLTYVIFLLEERFGDAFSINMGIPAGDNNFIRKKVLAVEIICSAYNLAENVFKSKEEFLNTKVDVLLKKTEYIRYTENWKDFYNIQIFPEAYAGLIYYTSQKKLGQSGINLTVDIGGGTTDISFFTIQNNAPVIYRYWSINRGLNYLAELSGFDYANKDFQKGVKEQVIADYNQKKKEIVKNLFSDLANQLKDTNIPKSALSRAFHTILYNGGGSMYSFLVESIYPFSDSHIVNKSIWDEEHVIHKNEVAPLCQVLTTAYGLSMCEEDKDVVLGNFGDIFSNVEKKKEKYQITKEYC